MINRQCQICLGYELDDGTSELCRCDCDEENIVECKNNCGQQVYDGGFCSRKCREEYEFEHGDDDEHA